MSHYSSHSPPCLKVVVLAHGPPPNHGQAFMVQQIVDGLKSGGADLICYHVNFKLSDDLEDIGSLRPQKLLRLLKHFCSVVWIKVRYQAHALFYIPAPPVRSALLRDCLVGFLLRPFFQFFILNHRAGGLAEFFSEIQQHKIKRLDACLGLLARLALKNPTLSIVLSPAGRIEAEALEAKTCLVVPSGIPDPCPTFVETLLPLRMQRWRSRSGHEAGSTCGFRVLFLSNCIREKGLFEAVHGYLIAREQLLACFPGIKINLDIAGGFPDPTAKKELEHIASTHPDAGITMHGFVSGSHKALLLRESDVLCLPTYYRAEGFPGVLIEAFAYGLPVITTDWRGIGDLLPPFNPNTVAPQSAQAVAARIVESFHFHDFHHTRIFYLEHFTHERFISEMRNAILSVAEPRNGHAA